MDFCEKVLKRIIFIDKKSKFLYEYNIVFYGCKRSPIIIVTYPILHNYCRC
jgi:hypothetical protein